MTSLLHIVYRRRHTDMVLAKDELSIMEARLAVAAKALHLQEQLEQELSDDVQKASAEIDELAEALKVSLPDEEEVEGEVVVEEEVTTTTTTTTTKK